MILANGQITATARPNFPWNTVHTLTRDNNKIWKINRPVPLNHDVPMDWHHIIPWKDLRNGWSALATSGRWEVLTEWIKMWNFDDVAGIVASMQANALGAPTNSDMWDKLCWAEWNIVEGPHNEHRVAGDDPGSEHLDAFEAICVPNNLRERSLILKSIYTMLSKWVATTNTITKDEAKPLVKDFQKLHTYKKSPIFSFSNDVWEMVDAGKIDQFGLAIKNKHFTWRKRTKKV